MGHDESWAGYDSPPPFVCLKPVSFARSPSSKSQIMCTLLRVHHGAATVTSKTDEEVMEEKKKKKDALEFQQVFFYFFFFTLENARARCQK